MVLLSDDASAKRWSTSGKAFRVTAAIWRPRFAKHLSSASEPTIRPECRHGHRIIVNCE